MHRIKQSTHLSCRSAARRVLGVVFAVSLVAIPTDAFAVPFDLTADGDFGPRDTNEVSVSATRTGLGLTLTSFTRIPEDGDELTGGEAGSVFIDDAGTGVKDDEGKGSKEISGQGGHRDEAITLTYATAVSTASVALVLTNVDDDATATVYIDSTSSPALDEVDVAGALEPIPGLSDAFMLSLADLGLPETFTTLHLRSTNGHFFLANVGAVAEDGDDTDDDPDDSAQCDDGPGGDPRSSPFRDTCIHPAEAAKSFCSRLLDDVGIDVLDERSCTKTCRAIGRGCVKTAKMARRCALAASKAKQRIFRRECRGADDPKECAAAIVFDAKLDRAATKQEFGVAAESCSACFEDCVAVCEEGL